MSLWRQICRGVRALLHGSAADQDVAEEIQHYLEQATAAHLARGLSNDAARRAAVLEIGNATIVREQVRASGWEHAVVTVSHDLRYAARGLRAAPGFTAITILTLALGVGGTTAIFSAVNPILFASLPYPHPDRATTILELHADGARSLGTFALFRAFADHSRSFEAIAVAKPWQPTVTGEDQPERFEGQRVSAGYFRVLGVSPTVGRDFDPSDDRVHGPDVVILSDALWRRRFGSDRGIVGRAITLDDSLYTVIGVMPADFENVLSPSAALWAPLQYDPALPSREGREWGHHLRTIARLQPWVPVDEATREVNALGRAVIVALHPETYDPNAFFAVAPMHDELIRGVKPALLAILGAVILVLVIACVNVTNLLLARGVHRRAEFALRTALGAAGRRLVQQLLTESLLLAAMGGVAGLAVAAFGVRALVALAPPGLPRADAIRVDGAMFAFGLAVTTLIGLVFGLLPALQAARSDPRSGLQRGTSATAHTAGGHRRTRNALVVAEVALAIVLVVSSGLLLRSLERLFAVPMGFDATRLLTMQVQESGSRFRQDDARYRFFSGALEAVRRVPGVTAAALTSQMPLSGDRDEYGAQFEATPTEPAATYSAFRYAVSPQYVATLGIPLLRGRLLDEHDDVAAPPVALISESLARSRFHGRDPIDQRVRFGGPATAPPYTIVGVVGDVKQLSLALTDADAVYIPTTQWHWVDTEQSLVVRVRGDAVALAPAIRQAIWSVDKDQPIVRIATMDELVAASAAERRFALVLFEAFALTALVLAAAGLYGLLAGSVAERTREIGVRTALGASRGSILALVVRQGMTLTAVGVAIGLMGAIAASQAIASLLFGVSQLDPVTYLGGIGLLAGVSCAACAVPGWRAARVDPALTLRQE